MVDAHRSGLILCSALSSRRELYLMGLYFGRINTEASSKRIRTLRPFQ